VAVAGASGTAPRRGRLALTIGLGLYGLFLLVRPGHHGWLDAVDLAIHEAGHLAFAPLGEFMTVLGGTLLQVIMPAAFVWYFARRGDRHAASVALWWVAQNLWNIAVYVQDAQTEALPLVGGGEHDWAYLLDVAGWLERDQLVGGLVRLAGTVVFAVAILWGLATAPARPSGERAA
jgi:hypothetical protein